MKKFSVKSLVFMFLLLPALAMANTKVGVLDFGEVMNKSTAIKSRVSQLERSLEADGKRLQKIDEDIAKIQERAERDGRTMSQSQQEALEKQFQEKVAEFQALRETLSRRQQEGEQKINEEMRPAFEQAIQQVVKAQKLDLVVEAGVVHFNAPQLDVTADVIKAINRIKK